MRVPTMSSALARAGLTPINKILPIQLPELVAWSSTSGRGCLLVLLRLAYLAVTNTMAMLRLLPMSDRAKDAEILALRHQATVLERHLHGQKIQFTQGRRPVVELALVG